MKKLYEASIRKTQQVTKENSMLRDRIAFLLEDIQAREKWQKTLESDLEEIKQKRRTSNAERTTSTAKICGLEMEVQKLTQSLNDKRKASSRCRVGHRNQLVQTELPVPENHDSDSECPHFETWEDMNMTTPSTENPYTSGRCNQTTQTDESCTPETRCQLCEKRKKPCVLTDDRRELLMSLQRQIIYLEETVIDVHSRLIGAQTSKSALVERMKQGIGSLQYDISVHCNTIFQYLSEKCENEVVMATGV